MFRAKEVLLALQFFLIFLIVLHIKNNSELVLMSISSTNCRIAGWCISIIQSIHNSYFIGVTSEEPDFHIPTERPDFQV